MDQAWQLDNVLDSSYIVATDRMSGWDAKVDPLVLKKMDVKDYITDVSGLRFTEVAGVTPPPNDDFVFFQWPTSYNQI